MQKINKLYAWVATDKDGGEGIIASQRNGLWFPMVSADRARVETLRAEVIDIGKISGLPIALLEFSERRVVEVLDDVEKG